MNNAQVQLSKFLSYALRHKPKEAGITLDSEGWAGVEDVLFASSQRGHRSDLNGLLAVVRDNDKQRFELSEDHSRIRARQGHSIQVDLGFKPVEPPETLFHGTVGDVLDSIRRQGLLKGSRQHVHLSGDEKTAIKVGQRRGTPVILRVRALDLHRAGSQFFLSTNGVWLTAHVPPEFIIEG